MISRRWGFLTLDESGITREANLTAASQLGVTRSHLIDKPFRFFIEADDRDRFHRYLKRIFATPGPRHCEIRLTRKDGGVLTARLDGVAVTDASGAGYAALTITDISDLKQAEQRLQASEPRFAAFMEHLPAWPSSGTWRGAISLSMKPCCRPSTTPGGLAG